MKRLMVAFLWLLLLGGLLGVQELGQAAPPGIRPADVNSTYVCYPTCVLPNYIIAEDLNSDGWLDLAVSCFGNSQVWLYENQGAPASLPGVFLPNPRGLGGPIGVPLGPVTLVSGVFAPIDGYPDIAVLSSVPSTVSGINFAASPTPPVRVTSPASPGGIPNPLPAPVIHMASGDFDRADGLSDVVVLDAGVLATGTPPALRFYTSNPSSVPPWIIGLPAFSPTFVVVADFNQDGWDDVAVCDTSNTVTIYYIRNGAQLGPAFPVALGAISPTAMDVADFNNDGFPDIVIVGNVGGNGFADVLLNRVFPVREFIALPPQSTWGLNTRFVKAFDADGNGWSDFATANYASNTITVFLTQPGNAAAANRQTRPTVCLKPKAVSITIVPKFKYELQCGYYPTCIAAGDFDRNGKMDIAVTLYSATKEICPQNPSCIEVIFDVACGTQPDQELHQIQPKQEPQECQPCKTAPCTGNTPPKPEIQTGSDSKN